MDADKGVSRASRHTTPNSWNGTNRAPTMATSKSSTRSRRSGRPSRHAGVAQGGILYPLDLVYARAGVDLPRARTVAPHEIPLPYRALLVHESDMTLTLERHFGGRVVLRSLSTFTIGEWYFRRVLLVQERSGRPVEMGAIRMKLGVFSARIRRQILANQIPLGRILRDGKVEYTSRPCAFLSVMPNGEMMGAFWMREPSPLYGRRTEMYQQGAKIGDIVEVLPLV